MSKMRKYSKKSKWKLLQYLLLVPLTSVSPRKLPGLESDNQSDEIKRLLDSIDKRRRSPKNADDSSVIDPETRVPLAHGESFTPMPPLKLDSSSVINSQIQEGTEKEGKTLLDRLFPKFFKRTSGR